MPITFTVSDSSLKAIRATNIPTKGKLLDEFKKMTMIERRRSWQPHAANRLEENIAKRRNAWESTLSYVVEDSGASMVIYASYGGRGWRPVGHGAAGDIGAMFEVRQMGRDLQVTARSRFEISAAYKLSVVLGFLACIIPGVALALWWWLHSKMEVARTRDVLIPAMIDTYSGVTA